MQTKWTLVLMCFCAWCAKLGATVPVVFENEASERYLIENMNTLLNNFPKFSDDEYRQRFMELSGEIDYRLDPLIKERIIVRTELYRESTERTLGLSDVYFPIFEEFLTKHNVPHHLKYLPIIESNLNPKAKSPAAAVGLWQFIPSTGKMYGLKISRQLDERSDTYKASDAAAQLLRSLYDIYGDWALALAAYNCGGGRVNAAMRTAKSNNYWEVRKFLPRETQKYVPYFMATVYVGEFFRLHKLNPQAQARDYVLTDTIMLYESASLIRLAADLKIDADSLRFLNPAYFRNHIPAHPNGVALVLPSRIVARLRGYETKLEQLLSTQNDNELRAVRRVWSEEDLAFLMRAHRCTRQDFLAWNNLPADYKVQAGDLLGIRRYRVSSDLDRKQEAVIKRSTVSVQGLRVVGIDVESRKTVVAEPWADVKKDESYLPTVVHASVPVAGSTHNAARRNNSYRHAVERQAKVETQEAAPAAKAQNQSSAPQAVPAAVSQQAVQANVERRSRQRRLLHTEAQTKQDKAQIQVFQPQIEDNPSEPYIYYTVKGNESLSDVHKLFPNSSIRDLMDLNSLELNSGLRAGQVLKIRR